MDPREHASQKFISHFVPILSVRSDAWWLLFFTTPHLPLSTVIRHVRDILNEAAAGVHTACPSFHAFRLQGYAYDFVWDMSVTYAVVSIQMSGSKRNKQWTWQPRSTTTNLSAAIHLRTGFYQCILYWCIWEAYIFFLYWKFFAVVRLTSLQA